MRPFFNTLRFKFLTMVLATLAITGVIFAYLQHSWHKREEMRDLEASAIRLGDLILSKLENPMILEDRDGAQRLVENITGGGELENLFILNKQGEVRFSSERNEIGKKLDLRETTCQLCHRLVKAEQRPRAVIFTKETGERIYRLVNPILNKAQCQGCHESKARLVGVQVADFSLEEIEASIARKMKRLIFYLLSAMAAIGLILWVLVDRTVIHRLGRLSGAAERIGKGNLDTRAEVKGEDEVGELARAFNTMADQLQTSIAQIEGYRQTLEEKFAEKIREFNALYAVSRAATGSLDLDEVLNIALEKAMDVMEMEAGGILLLEPDGETMTLKVHRGLSDEFVQAVLKIRLGEGISGKAAQMRMPLSLDVADYPTERLGPIVVKEGLQSLASTPLIAENRVQGAITLATRQSRVFSREKLDVLTMFANHAAISIENYKLYEMQLKKTQELAGLIKSGQAVSSSLSIENVLKSVVFLAAQVMGVSTCVLMLLDEKGEELMCRAQIGLPDEWVRDERHRVGVSLSGLVALEGKTLSVLDIASDPRAFHQGMARKYGFASYLGVPIKARERLLGVLSILTKRPRSFTEDEISLLSTFADQAAIAIENARLFESELKLLKEAQERRRLEEVSRIRSEFIAHVSHELRTPLNSILGFSELLFDGKVGELNEKQSRYINNVLESGRHLLNIINDIIDISKVDTGKIELKPEDFLLYEALEAALTIIRPQAQNKGISMRLDLEPGIPIIRADPVRFKQIMYNLLSNAVKFTPDGGQVRVTAQLVRGPMSDVRSQEVTQGLSPELRTTDYGRFVQVSVTDTGIGIKPEDQPKLFKEFSQIESVYAKRYQGTGLGLALTKRLVELHGGRIWVESEGEGRGSTFTFILPLSH